MLDSLLPLRCGAAKASLCCVSVLRCVLSAFVRLCAASLRQSPPDVLLLCVKEVEVSFGAQTRQTEAKRHKSIKVNSELRSKEVFWFWWAHVRLCCPRLWSLLLEDQDQDQRDDDVLAALPAAL